MLKALPSPTVYFPTLVTLAPVLRATIPHSRASAPMAGPAHRNARPHGAHGLLCHPCTRCNRILKPARSRCLIILTACAAVLLCCSFGRIDTPHSGVQVSPRRAIFRKRQGSRAHPVCSLRLLVLPTRSPTRQWISYARASETCSVQESVNRSTTDVIILSDESYKECKGCL